MKYIQSIIVLLVKKFSNVSKPFNLHLELSDSSIFFDNLFIINNSPNNANAKSNMQLEPIIGNVERNLFAGTNILTIPTSINKEPNNLPFAILQPSYKTHFFFFSIAFINCVKYIHINANTKLYIIRNIVKNENILFYYLFYIL